MRSRYKIYNPGNRDELILEGGVKFTVSADKAREYARKMLGNLLVTHQTGPEGKIFPNGMHPSTSACPDPEYEGSHDQDWHQNAIGLFLCSLVVLSRSLSEAIRTSSCQPADANLACDNVRLPTGDGPSQPRRRTLPAGPWPGRQNRAMVSCRMKSPRP